MLERNADFRVRRVRAVASGVVRDAVSLASKVRRARRRYWYDCLGANSQ